MVRFGVIGSLVVFFFTNNSLVYLPDVFFKVFSIELVVLKCFVEAPRKDLGNIEVALFMCEYVIGLHQTPGFLLIEIARDVIFQFSICYLVSDAKTSAG